MTAPLLEIENLRVDLRGRHRGDPPRRVIHDVSLRIEPGESVGLVGESGSGKSMTLKAVMGLLPQGAKVSGAIRFRGRDVTAFGRKDLAGYRSRQVAMIYQDPRAHTNPLVKVGDFLIEGVVAAKQMTPDEARDKACAMLRDVGVPDATRRMAQYPHELSGGLLQRVMIVMALMPDPLLVLADEPTTALDVTVQAEVVSILIEQIRERSVGMLFITHDLDLAAAINDSLAVMYAGAIVEKGSATSVYEASRHPYTAGLLNSRPSVEEVRRLQTIPGRPLSAFEAGDGCVFSSRCHFVTQHCRDERPAARPVDGHIVACHRVEELDKSMVRQAA
ncbi:ABC transporter ATP-binding protein [Dactylosporangium sp. NPDC048998]|uniref:ABC transporter ATP-binding protein n=1 Tax=Dactylosporangium sp. NPDC048998 TaxID=3363976 RepID=UPI003710E47B